MERHEIIVPHVPAHARGRQDDDVFTRHVSDAGNDGTWYVPRPHGPESLQLHPMWSHWVSQKTCSVRLTLPISSPKSHPNPPKRTMTNRFQLLAMVHTVMIRIENATSREQRFTLLDNAQFLYDILQEITQYEHRLITDLDVD